MWLYLEIVFEEVLKARIEIRSHWIRVGPKFSETVFIRDRKGYTKRDEGHVKAEVGRDWSDAAQSQTREYLGPLEARKSEEQLFPKTLEGSAYLPTLVSDLWP